MSKGKITERLHGAKRQAEEVIEAARPLQRRPQRASTLSSFTRRRNDATFNPQVRREADGSISFPLFNFTFLPCFAGQAER